MAKLSVAQALLRATGHLRKGELDAARALYSEILAAFPMNDRAQQGLAKLNSLTAQSNPPQDQLDALIVAYGQQRYGAMVDQAERMLTAHPNAFVLWNILAAGRKALGQLAEAEKDFRKAAELNPSYADAHINLGVTLQEQGKLDAAIAAYRHALSINPAYAEAHNNMGNALKDQGHLDQAIAAYQQALHLKHAYAEAHNNLGVAWQMTGDAEAAIASYRRALDIHPTYVEALNNLGVTLQDAGQLDEAIAAFDRALAIRPTYAEAHSNRGNALKAQDRLDAAMAAYQRAVELRPGYAEAHNNMGNVLKDQGKPDEAMAAFQRALHIRPGYAEAHNNMGVTLQEQGDLEAAMAAYQCALAIKPDYAQAQFNIGNALKEQGLLPAAVAAYQRALEIRPGYAEACNNMGDALKDQGDHAAAIDAFQRAIEIKPGYAEAYNNLGVALQELREFDAALAALRCAVDFKPAYAEAYNNIGVTLQEQRKFDEAIAAYHQALEIKPDYPEACCNASSALLTVGDTAAAVDFLSKAIAADPAKAKYRLSKLCSVLPIVWAPGSDPDPLHAFDAELASLTEWAATDAAKAALADSAGAHQPFHLAYYPENMAGRLGRYGRLLCDVQPGRTGQIKGRSPMGKIVIGVVSAHIRYHSVFNVIIKGLLENLDASRFSTIVYDLKNTDAAPAFSAPEGALLVRPFPERAAKEAVRAQIEADAVDVLLYPEIGMDKTTTWLASQRLAKVQAAAWGHPITTGLSTIDYFLSGDLLEGPEADSHYTETLIRLPGTGCYTDFTPQAAEPCRFEVTSLPPTAPRLIIAQNPFKFHPDNDDLIIAIAQRCPDAVLLIPSSDKFPNSLEKILARIDARARDTGQGTAMRDRFVVLPWLPAAEFQNLLEQVDVFLDLPTFSGYTTAWQAIHCGLPVVTLEGRFMRQRLAAGLLRQAGIPDTIAQSAPAFVEIVADLAERSRDKRLFGDYRQQIRAAAPKADHNLAAVRAFEDFIDRALGGIA